MPDFNIAELVCFIIAAIIASGVSMSMSLPWMGAAFGAVAVVIGVVALAKYLEGV